MHTHPLLKSPPKSSVSAPRLGLDGLKLGEFNPGRVSVVSQSKAMLGAVADWAKGEAYGFSWLVHTGLDSERNLTPWLEAMAFEPHTRAVLVYLDDLPPAQTFLSNLRLLASLKPVVILKAQQSDFESLTNAAFARVGALRVSNVNQWLAALRALETGTHWRPPLRVVSNGRAPIHLAADQLPNLSERVDLDYDAGLSAWKKALNSDTSGSTLAVYTPNAQVSLGQVLQAVAHPSKTLVAQNGGRPVHRQGAQVFSSIESAATAWRLVSEHAHNQALARQIPAPARRGMTEPEPAQVNAALTDKAASLLALFGLKPSNGPATERVVLVRNPQWGAALLSDGTPLLLPLNQHLVRLAKPHLTAAQVDAWVALSHLIVRVPKICHLSVVLDPAGGVVDHSLELGKSAIHLSICPYPSHLTHSWRIGTQSLVCRAIRPEDAQALGAFYQGLSQASRNLRFMGSVAKVSDALIARFCQIDYARDVGLVVIHQSDVVGTARYDLDADGEAGEFALTIADGFQRMGLGSRLMHTLLQAAKDRGLTTIEGEVLTRNGPMLELMRKLDFRLSHDPEDPTVTRVVRELRDF